MWNLGPRGCIRYLRYVLRHKWFVFVACSRKHMLWRGIVHDLSKLRPSEFIPYANFFYGRRAVSHRDGTGYYKPTDTGDSAFDRAWFLHQKKNEHHWQYWVLPVDGGGTKVLEMPVEVANEMICDWIGAGRAQGTPDTQKWYEANKHKMSLHPSTSAYVEYSLFGGGK